MRIFLTGMPGSGKTFLGKLWADDHGLSFFDLDTMIEDEERMPVDKIFAEKGEDYFREKEAAVLRNTDRYDKCIIACGGGTPCFYDNADWMGRNGITVFLDESPENIFHHIINDKKNRPLLPKDPDAIKETIVKISAQRKTCYNQSKFTLAPGSLNRSGFNELIKLIKNA